jgi:hypothetical protein
MSLDSDSTRTMQAETKTVIYILTTILLIVASSFAALGYLANHAIVAKAGAALQQAPDVQLVERRAEILLAATVALWAAAVLVFARVLSHRPERGARSYVTSAVLVSIAIGVTVAILHFTADALKLM